MKVAIIEDEPLAIEKIERYLKKSSIDIEVVARLNSNASAIPWISLNQDEVDIFFMDIQLGDGLSFDIFANIEINRPVIFITAFDEYAIDAFKVNSIDYLLKPITFTALNKALEKYQNLQHQFQLNPNLQPILKDIRKHQFKQRFLVKKGMKIKSLKTGEIAYFYAEGRDVFLMHESGNKYIIDYRLEELADFVDGHQFYRINRSLIVNINAISEVDIHSNRRLKLNLRPEFKAEAIVSREKVGNFKKWYEGEK